MMNYANGGLHNLAHHVRGKGRGKDSMLVHMTPREVQGLQALAKAKGGTLTINPETGLPEAGFLEDVLPVVALAAATYFTAGAAAPALAGALGSAGMAAGTATTVGGALAGAGAGAISGGIGAAMKGGDVGKGALMGGIGGGITGGMGGYDNVYGAVDAANAGNLAQANQAAMTAPTDVSDVYSGLAGQPSVPPGTMPSPNLQPGATVSGTAAAQLPEGAARNAALNSVADANKVFPEGASQLGGPGLTEAPSRLANAQEIVRPDSYYQKAGLMGKTAILAAPGIGGAMGGEKPYEVPGEEPYVNQSLLSPNFRGYTPAQPDPYYRAQYTRYAAGGGLMDLRSFDDENGVDMASGGDTRKKKRASLTADRTINSLDPYNAAIAQLNNARYGANMSGINALNPNMTSLGELPVIAGAKGGIASLGGYSDGGRMLRGPGDGMSDSIPGVIGNKQPARLADGEFVVPADVVSHLGNGSTDAGARKLYAMMDKIRKARTGKKKQAPEVRASKYMPA